MMITISYKDNNNKISYYFEAIINSTIVIKLESDQHCAWQVFFMLDYLELKFWFNDSSFVILYGMTD